MCVGILTKRLTIAILGPSRKHRKRMRWTRPRRSQQMQRPVTSATRSRHDGREGFLPTPSVTLEDGNANLARRISPSSNFCVCGSQAASNDMVSRRFWQEPIVSHGRRSRLKPYDNVPSWIFVRREEGRSCTISTSFSTLSAPLCKAYSAGVQKKITSKMKKRVSPGLLLALASRERCEILESDNGQPDTRSVLVRSSRCWSGVAWTLNARLRTCP